MQWESASVVTVLNQSEPKHTDSLRSPQYFNSLLCHPFISAIWLLSDAGSYYVFAEHFNSINGAYKQSWQQNNNKCVAVKMSESELIKKFKVLN